MSNVSRRRRQSLLDDTDGVEIMLPVTPGSYSWENGINVNVTTIEGLGSIHLPGYKFLDTRQIDCMFPAQAYPFVEAGADLNPLEYVYRLEKWCQAGKKLRYIVSGSILNARVFIERIKYMEQDGTHDVYATITLRQYQSPGQVSAQQQGEKRESDTVAVTATDYMVVKGDTLSAICRKHYGDATLYPLVGDYNHVKNYNLIFPGQVFQLPPLSALKGG